METKIIKILNKKLSESSSTVRAGTLSILCVIKTQIVLIPRSFIMVWGFLLYALGQGLRKWEAYIFPLLSKVINSTLYREVIRWNGNNGINLNVTA